MVELLCPHCDEEIELPDDASGLFECPYCEGEFEWNMDGEEDTSDVDEFDRSEGQVENSDGRFYTTDFQDIPALPMATGVLFGLWMGIYTIVGFTVAYGGLLLNSVESEFSTGTSFGLGLILLGIVIIGVGITGIYFGVKTALRDIKGVVGLMIISGVGVVLSLLQWGMTDAVGPLFVHLTFLVLGLCCFLIPIFKAQFTGVLVTSTEPNAGPAREKQFSFKGKPVHLVEWLSHSFSIMTLLLLIVCFSSTWYTISAVGEGELSASMGLSDAEMTEDNESEKITFDEAVDDLQASYSRMCVEQSDYDCYEVLEELEYWKSWKNAGSLLNVLLICCTLAAVASVVSRIVIVLTNLEVVEIPDTPYIVSELIRKFAPFVISGLLFVGTIIYMIINPGTAMLESPEFTLESSFGAIVWISLAVPILTTILTFYEIEFMP